MRVAIAHDYLTQRGGAERVVLSMLRAFPGAPLYTLLYEPSATFPEFADYEVRVSPLNRFAPFRRDHRAALPVLAPAASAFRVDADVVLASTSGWAHGFSVGSARLLAYCYSPARWLYQGQRYLGADSSGVRRFGLAALRAPLVRWDRAAARRVDRYLAISTVVQSRIAEAYGRSSALLPAPHTLSADRTERRVKLPARFEADGFYLCLSRLLPYKNVDKVIEGCMLRSAPLVIVGKGPELERLRACADDRVIFLSDLSDSEVRWLYSRTKAVVAASFEDYGLTPIEGAVYGRPSVALRYGGFLDTILEGHTGVLFDNPTGPEIAEALGRFESISWSQDVIKAHAAQFDEKSFAERLRREVGA